MNISCTPDEQITMLGGVWRADSINGLKRPEKDARWLPSILSKWTLGEISSNAFEVPCGSMLNSCKFQVWIMLCQGPIGTVF